MDLEVVNLLGAKFTTSSYTEIKKALNDGALMVVPSGPGLATIDEDRVYYDAIRFADFALFDSGYFVLLCRLFGIGNYAKYSGYAFLTDFFEDPSLRGKRLLLVDPTTEESRENQAYLESLNLGLRVSSHVAPMYGNVVKDEELKKRVVAEKPDFLLLNIGGGVQEVLGAWLKREIDVCPGIICTGAAIAFLTGRQAPVTNVVDKLYLGWLARSLHSPRKFVLRYLAALKLFVVLWNRRHQL